MKASIFQPRKEQLNKYLHQQKDKDYSYAYLHQTKNQGPKHFDNDHNQINLGIGEELWRNAKAALLKWEHFPKPWTKIFDPNLTVEVGQEVAVLFRIFGLWWINSARIVYLIDEPNRFGFAYGTLPSHIEKGEEVFYLERNAEGEITYHIKAFSRPAHPLVWMVYPMARFFQRRFVKESMQTMKAVTQKSIPK